MNIKRTQNTIRPSLRLTPSPARGFSLVEVLIALGVFAVGFIAVASMFPAAIMLQKQTMLDLETKVVEQNVAGVIQGRGLTFSTNAGLSPDLSDTTWLDFNAEPFTGAALSGALGAKWSLPDRGYPTFMTDLASRRFFWVPFLRQTAKEDPMNAGFADPTKVTGGTYSVLAFIQQREPGKTYADAATDYTVVANPGDGDEVPKVVQVKITLAGTDNNQFVIDAAESANAKLHFAAFEPGDSVADNLGNTYVIQDVAVNGTSIQVGGIVPLTVTHLWYGAPADGKDHTSTVAIVTLAGMVKTLN